MKDVSMEDIIERFKDRRKHLNLSFQDLAILTGMSKSTLQRYESGAIKNIPLSRVEDLASALQTTPEYLMGWEDDPLDYDKIASDSGIAPPRDYDGEPMDYIKAVVHEDESGQTRENPSNIISLTGMVPIVGTIPAGVPVLAFENIEGYMPTMVKNPQEYFALRVKGESMKNAGIPNGSIVLIHQQKTAENGQIVACRVNGDEATLKRYKPVGETIVLMPENPDFQPIVVSGKDFNSGYAEIIGVAKQVIMDL